MGPTLSCSPLVQAAEVLLRPIPHDPQAPTHDRVPTEVPAPHVVLHEPQAHTDHVAVVPVAAHGCDSLLDPAHPP